MTDVDWREGLTTAGTDPGRRLELVRRALELRPDSPALYARLGDVLMESGSHGDAAEAYRRALELEPGFTEAALGLAFASAELGREDEAIARFREVSGDLPDHFGAAFGLGRTLARAGRSAEAVEPLRRASRLEPDHFHALHYLVRVLLQADAGEEALAACDESLDRVAGNVTGLGLKSQVLEALGRREEAARLLGMDRFVRTAALDPPEGFEDLDSFNRALADSIRSNPGLEFEPRGLATRKGTQTFLSSSEDRPEALLYRSVRRAMESYRREVAAGPPHPFSAAAPERAKLSMWTVVLREGGHQTPHIHPGGWLSGVYYVEVPEGGPDRVGQIIVGCADRFLGLEAEPNARAITPEEGLLLLFPSYHYHRTIPTRSSEERICVAFNVLTGE